MAKLISERVAELRRLTVESRELAVPVQYFHEELVALAAFTESGVSAEHPMLEEIVEQAIERAGFDMDTIFMLIRVPGHGLWHGAANFKDEGFAVFFYFDELDVGIAQVVTTLDEDEQHYLRFTCVPIDSLAPVGGAPGGMA
jgi:hypothetical protein